MTDEGCSVRKKLLQIGTVIKVSKRLEKATEYRQNKPALRFWKRREPHKGLECAYYVGDVFLKKETDIGVRPFTIFHF